MSTKIYKNNKPLEEYWDLGFLIPSILFLDSYGSERWDWWSKYKLLEKTPDSSIPQINWTQHAGSKKYQEAMKLLTDCCSQCNLDDFLDFIMYGLGDKNSIGWRSLPHTVIKIWETNLGEALPIMMLYPYSYFSDLIQQEMGRSQRGKSAFFCTPMYVSVMMTEMQMHDLKDITKSVCDPCCGTGNLLLAASNYSINLYGMDNNQTVLKGLKIHAYMYVPWLIVPLDSLRKTA